MFSNQNIFKNYFLLLIVVLIGFNHTYSQKNDSLVPDFSVGVSPQLFFFNEIHLNELYNVYGKLKLVGGRHFPIAFNAKRFNALLRLTSYDHNFVEGVENYTNLTVDDRLNSRVSSFSIGYRLLQRKSLFIQPMLEYSRRFFNVYNTTSNDEILSFNGDLFGFGVDVGYAIISSRFNLMNGDKAKYFLEVGASLQFRYFYSKRYPFYETVNSNHIFAYSFTIYASVGLWDIFRK